MWRMRSALDDEDATLSRRPYDARQDAVHVSEDPLDYDLTPRRRSSLRHLLCTIHHVRHTAVSIVPQRTQRRGEGEQPAYHPGRHSGECPSDHLLHGLTHARL